ncbi:cuticle protein 10.6-like [Lucilia cuprina]|uniref:cuticle protein 10.6-like n=1 Tax=Lucilia cuprina TaxID=7375 RepID=UPI001F06483F|nr:cuticle protein 10.6-like [Lucilia cuprina]
MFKFVVVFAAWFAYAAAGVVRPTALAAAPAAVAAYANAPLYAAGGSQQIDVRHNYDGTLSSYTTTPFAYTSPVSSRYVAGAPAAYAAPAFAAPAAYAAAPAAFAAHAKYVAPAGVASPFAVASPYAAHYAAPYAAHYAAPYAAHYASGFATPFAAAPAKVVV